jgi:hypothetical protein
MTFRSRSVGQSFFFFSVNRTENNGTDVPASVNIVHRGPMEECTQQVICCGSDTNKSASTTELTKVHSRLAKSSSLLHSRPLKTMKF